MIIAIIKIPKRKGPNFLWAHVEKRKAWTKKNRVQKRKGNPKRQDYED